jgi:SAM-dependent methyltransferase
VNSDDPLQQARARAAVTYNAAADHFEDEPLAFWTRIGTRTIERLGLRPGATVLDVGCGTGASALPAAEAVAPNGHVIGIDLADRMVDQARDKARTRGLTNVDFRVGDMTATGIPDATYDAVVSVFSVFFVPDMVGLVRELWRMVRPGGQLAVTTWGPDFLGPAYGRWLEAVRAVRPDLYRSFNPWDRLTEPAAVVELLSDGGAAGAIAEREDGFQRLRSPEDWWTVVLGNGTRWTVDQLSPDDAARVREDNLRWVADNHIDRVATNAIYAIARKPAPTFTNLGQLPGS